MYACNVCTPACLPVRARALHTHELRNLTYIQQWMTCAIELADKWRILLHREVIAVFTWARACLVARSARHARGGSEAREHVRPPPAE